MSFSTFLLKKFTFRNHSLIFFNFKYFCLHREAKNKEGNETELKISTALPGWGEWGGTGLVLSKRKRKRFTTVKLPPRKDKNKADIIINEDENPNVRNHLVSYSFENKVN